METGGYSDPEKTSNATLEAAKEVEIPTSKGSSSTSVKVIGRLIPPEVGIIVSAELVLPLLQD
jgi:hypothetical protein